MGKVVHDLSVQHAASLTGQARGDEGALAGNIKPEPLPPGRGRLVTPPQHQTHPDRVPATGWLTPGWPRARCLRAGSGVIPGHTRKMKTAISIPDDTFNEAERYAAELGISRSEFFTTAARHYIQELDAQSLTARINAALALAGSDESSQAAVRAGRRVLADGDDW